MYDNRIFYVVRLMSHLHILISPVVFKTIGFSFFILIRHIARFLNIRSRVHLLKSKIYYERYIICYDPVLIMHGKNSWCRFSFYNPVFISWNDACILQFDDLLISHAIVMVQWSQVVYKYIANRYWNTCWFAWLWKLKYISCFKVISNTRLEDKTSD